LDVNLILVIAKMSKKPSLLEHVSATQLLQDGVLIAFSAALFSFGQFSVGALPPVSRQIARCSAALIDANNNIRGSDFCVCI
jgi:hypothetical protein